MQKTFLLFAKQLGANAKAVNAGVVRRVAQALSARSLLTAVTRSSG
jgi:hypothetical protein